MSRPLVRVVATLGTAQTVAWASSYYLPAIVAKGMAADLGVTTPWVFLAFSAGLLISGFVGPLSGRLIDAHGGHRVLPASNLLFATGLVSLSLANGPASLIAGWLIMGFAMSFGLYEAAFATLARIYGRDARRAITGIALVAGCASTLGWPLTAWLEVSFGWRAACLAWAGAHLLICLPLNFSLPAETHPSRVTDDAAPAPAPDPRKRWIIAALALVFAGTLFGSASMAAHLPRILQEAGASLPAAIAAAALVGPSQVVARILEFTLMRRLQPLTSAQLATLAHPVGAGILLATGAPAAPVFTVAHGAGNGVMTIARGTLPLHLFGAGGYGLRQGLLMMPARFSQACAPLVFDLLLSHLGTAALAVTAALGVLSFLTLTAVRALASR